jgi:hypothetical protein
MMSGPTRSFASPSQSTTEIAVGVQPVQSVAMALLREHDLINASRDSMGTYRVLMNHLSWELPMIRAVFAPWKEKELTRKTGMSPAQIKQFRAKAEELETRMRGRKHAHDVKIHTEPIGGHPPKYLVEVTDPNRPTLDPPIIVYGVDLPGVLQVKHESQKEATFESAVIELFGVHLDGHNLLADAGELDLTTSISNLRGYSRQDRTNELSETIAAREEGEKAESLSAFSARPPVVPEDTDGTSDSDIESEGEEEHDHED